MTIPDWNRHFALQLKALSGVSAATAKKLRHKPDDNAKNDDNPDNTRVSTSFEYIANGCTTGQKQGQEDRYKSRWKKTQKSFHKTLTGYV
ncbi:hypothetical protein GCM10028818_41330 [Spirosoma horti]